MLLRVLKVLTIIFIYQNIIIYIMLSAEIPFDTQYQKINIFNNNNIFQITRKITLQLDLQFIHKLENLG